MTICVNESHNFTLINVEKPVMTATISCVSWLSFFIGVRVEPVVEGKTETVKRQ